MKLPNMINQKKISNNKIIILGGGGFIGRELVKFYLNKKIKISVLDKNTSKLKKMIKNDNFYIKVYKKNILSIKKNSQIFNKYNVIINCIGSKDHNLAIKDPVKDIDVNVTSLLHILKNFKNKKLIQLGTTHQYSGSRIKLKNFDHTFATDVQGISKNAIENYLIYYSKKIRFDLICLRVGNCFGNSENGLNDKEGLFFQIINSFLKKKKFILYKKNVKKNFCYTPDVVRVINFLINKKLKFPIIFNYIQYNISVENLIKKITKYLKYTKFKYTKKKITINNYDFSDMTEGNLYKKFPNLKSTSIDEALKKIILLN